MKNVTISMDEDMVEWARVEAARSGQSLSRWIASRLEQDRVPPSDLEAKMAAVFATPLAPMSDGGRTFNREEIYDRKVFKRFR